MKKIILASLLLVGGLYANDATRQEVIQKDYKNTKEMMSDMKQQLPVVYNVISSYFQAKTCSEDITDKITIKQIRNFAAGVQFGTLIDLKFRDDVLSRAHYDSFIHGYKFMQCGNADDLSIYIGNISAIAVELEDTKK